MKNSMTFSVKNPLTRKVIGEAPDMSRDDTISLIYKGQEAFNSWKQTTPKDRGKILKRWHALTLKNIDVLAQIIHLEQGKSVEEAKEEIHDGALFFEWYADEAERLHGYTPLSPDTHLRMVTLKQPIGVVGVITPWNFPSAIPLQKCIPAIAAGCTTILKPSEETPLSSLAHKKLAFEAGIPDGVFNVITCKNPQQVGLELCHNPLVRKLTFTGSTKVGRHLMKESGKTVKKISLELGGNSPLVVFDDANIDLAVQKTVNLKTYNSGQVCNNINRFFLHESIHQPFISKFLKKIQSIKLAPLCTPQVTEKVVSLLVDAREKGGEIIGGKCNGQYIEPTLVIGATPQMRIFHEEIFGPIAPIYSFKYEKDVIALANNTHYGLAAYVFTENIGRAYRVAEAFDAGSIGINTTDVYSELLPFGGWKQSGINREMGLEKSLDDFLETKSLVLGNL